MEMSNSTKAHVSCSFLAILNPRRMDEKRNVIWHRRRDTTPACSALAAIYKERRMLGAVRTHAWRARTNKLPQKSAE